MKSSWRREETHAATSRCWRCAADQAGGRQFRWSCGFVMRCVGLVLDQAVPGIYTREAVVSVPLVGRNHDCISSLGLAGQG